MKRHDPLSQLNNSLSSTPPLPRESDCWLQESSTPRCGGRQLCPRCRCGTAAGTADTTPRTDAARTSPARDTPWPRRWTRLIFPQKIFDNFTAACAAAAATEGGWRGLVRLLGLPVLRHAALLQPQLQARGAQRAAARRQPHREVLLRGARHRAEVPRAAGGRGRGRAGRGTGTRRADCRSTRTRSAHSHHRSGTRTGPLNSFSRP